MFAKIAEGIDLGQSALAGESPAFALLTQHLFQLVEQFPIWTAKIAAFDIEIASVKFVALAAPFSGGLHFSRHELDTALDIDVEILKHAV